MTPVPRQIPEFDADGLLPAGIHDATLGEIRERFGRFQSSDRRSVLVRKLELFLNDLRRVGIIVAVFVNGSFVTETAEPNDIDLILVVGKDHNFATGLPPDAYNVLSHRRVRRRYGFDVLVARENGPELERYVSLFQQVRGKPSLTKGILRVQQ